MAAKLSNEALMWIGIGVIILFTIVAAIGFFSDNKKAT